MSNVYFVATDFYLKGGYGSYKDWFRLAELSGYPVIPLSELDPQSDNVYIVTPLNDEWLAGWDCPRARIIHYELEYRWDWRANVNEPPGVAEVWAGDRYYAQKIGARYVPIGSHHRLNKFTDAFSSIHKEYDVALMMYRDPPRRAKLINQITEVGLSIAADGWEDQRSAILMSCACMLAVHQLDNMPVLPPLRTCIAAAHKLAIISEHIEDAGILKGMVDHYPYADLARMTALTVRDPFNRLREQGEALYHALCVGYTFKQSIERAL